MDSKSRSPNVTSHRPSRLAYVAAAAVTIAVGLIVYLRGGFLQPSARDIVGDTLWAAMMAWLVAVIAPGAKPLLRGSVAYAICVAVEVSQAFHSVSLDAIRATTVGHLVLGSGFDPRDLAAYATGVVAAVLLEAAARKQSRFVRRT